MAVAQWKSLRSLDTIQSSTPSADANLWLGQQGITGISKFQLQSTSSEIVVELELADIDTKHLEVKLSPDLLTLSGILYETDSPSDQENGIPPLDNLSQPRSFRDLIPIPALIIPAAATAVLNGQSLKITLPKAMENPVETVTSAHVYYYPQTLSICAAKPLERGGMSDLLVPNFW